MPSLTVAVCTYNRPELLRKCLASLESQTAPRAAYGVLVVDNYGSDICRGVSRHYGARYVREELKGLSHARNRALREANTPWVLYVDDDALAHNNLIERLLPHLADQRWAAVGGRFLHWFLEPPPPWLRLYYTDDGYRPSPARRPTELEPPYYLVGGVLAVRTALARRVGGFDPKLGMSGGRVGYAEEDELQDRLRRAGGRICYDPGLVIDHAVQHHKYSIESRVEMAFASARDRSWPEFPDRLRGPCFLLSVLRITLLTVPYDLLRWAFRPGFYWQNAVVSTGTKYAYAWGSYRNVHRRG